MVQSRFIIGLHWNEYRLPESHKESSSPGACGGGWKMKKRQNLTELEKEVYDFVKARGEVLTTNIPPRMRGVIPNLRNKGVIEVYKKITSERRMKKRKFLRIKERLEGEEPVAS
jgi:hypothetical protein